MFTDEQKQALREMIAEAVEPITTQLKDLDENVSALQIGGPERSTAPTKLAGTGATADAAPAETAAAQTKLTCPHIMYQPL